MGVKICAGGTNPSESRSRISAAQKRLRMLCHTRTRPGDIPPNHMANICKTLILPVAIYGVNLVQHTTPLKMTRTNLEKKYCGPVLDRPRKERKKITSPSTHALTLAMDGKMPFCSRKAPREKIAITQERRSSAQ